MSRPFAAAVQFALVGPAALFLLAVVARGVGPLESEPAQTAQAIAAWYSGRIWTLWVLLLALPVGAFLIGGAIAFATVVAGLILAVVVLHMLAN